MVSFWRAASNNVLSISGSFILFVVKPRQLCFTTFLPVYYLSSCHNMLFLLHKMWLWNAFALMHRQWLKRYIIYSGDISHIHAQVIFLERCPHTLNLQKWLLPLQGWGVKTSQTPARITTFKVDNVHRGKRCFIYTFCRHTAALAFIWSCVSGCLLN